MIYRGKVATVGSTGVHVIVTELHPTQAFGPLLYAGAKPAVGDMVLVAVVGADETLPDMVVISPVGDSGSITNDMLAGSIARSKISGLPTSSTDNTVVRFDGTSGAMQTSTAVIDDSGNVTGVGDITTSTTAPTWRVAGSTGTTALVMDAANGQSARLVFRTGTSQRWIVHRTATSESGSNVGSNFVFNRRDDSGNSLGDALTLWRSSGKITVHTATGGAGLELGSSGPRIMAGANTPEAAVTAPIGSIWLRTNGGAGTTLYIKESGTGNTGWIAK